VAAVLGLIHAAWSAYWAAGGTYMLSTVGQWAVDLAEREPLQAGITLAAVAAVKVAIALAPLQLPRAAVYGRSPVRVLGLLT